MKYKDGDTRAKFLFGIVTLSILFVLVVYFEIKQQEVREKYRLDYILEDKVVKEIESNKIVDLEKLAKIKFSKIAVYPSYSSIKDFKSFINYYNKAVPKDYFNYIVFLDEKEDLVKVMVLNKKYDILGDKSCKEYLNKETIFKFNKVNKNNDTAYTLYQ
ncbi:TPA: hypothetical protein KRH38_003907 [Clostridioides difficile]|uniref:hypothetical protein n=1 Tax=Clostridioides difficile TaxID=1496 RepID=UPI001C18277C|nr:hypothetical protein [Clostridioides difficile]